VKTTKSLAISVIGLSILASKAFALITSPYPRTTSPPDAIIVITDDRHDSLRSTVRPSKQTSINKHEYKKRISEHHS
jgi:hypothetical protein